METKVNKTSYHNQYVLSQNEASTSNMMLLKRDSVKIDENSLEDDSDTFSSAFTFPALNFSSISARNCSTFVRNCYNNRASNENISDSGGWDPTDSPQMPKELTDLSESSKIYIMAYCILFLLATSANLTVLVSCKKQYAKSKSRFSLLILHLSIADLVVCCTYIPTEIFWRLTIQWKGGNVICKMMQFLRAFGLYHSNMVLICVSFDRFFAILFPMKMIRGLGDQRVKIMLWIAWIASAAFSAPQAILFSISSHPEYPLFKQCVTNEQLKSTEQVRMYSIFSISAMYFAPLIVIICTYTAILIKLIKRERNSHEPEQSVELRRHQRQNRCIVKFSVDLFKSSENSNNASISNGSNSGTTQEDALIPSVEDRLQQQDTIRQNHSVSRVSEKTTTPTALTNIVVVDRARNSNTRTILRRSENAVEQISRAKYRTLLISLVFVVVFVVCWTPYVVMTLWYMIDWERARDVDPTLQDGLLLMAVANSFVNPLIYGSLTKTYNPRNKIFGCLERPRT